METNTPLRTPSSTHRPIQIVLVRANGPLFYSVAAASLLEAIAPLYARRLVYLARDDDALTRWIADEWLPKKAERARVLQDYVQRTWPELDWYCAHDQYCAQAAADGGLGPQRATLAHELLARCVAAAQSGVIYRCLARWADDPCLRALAAEIAQDEADCFAYFRAAYERVARAQRFGIAKAWRTARACVRTARDTHLPLVFRALNAQCGPQVPFPVLRYSEFLRRMRPVIARYAYPGSPERLLFRPWLGRPRVPKVYEKQHRHPDWFKPLFNSPA
ncbi:MAG TPA: hypothetical protein VHP37_09885 [Burkholderiales bacterium]|nr:hypothetical protein [Burkholderiales bacterium]